ncbi:MAG: hypothetical protein LUH02_12250 [Erysipelotrichaceae bacterium]|nr:hypothetical protein [Erysipelotrichaceae bacterium]
MTKEQIIQEAKNSYDKYFREIKPADEAVDRHDVVLDVNKLESEIAAMVK